jgi:RNA polymerase sigma factor (sigma-70 family)
MDDATLLRQYANHRSEDAFRTLVQRHADWLYSASLRMVRNATLAEDVTQAVFVALARRAGTIRSEAALASWLFKATRFAAIDALRRERRRRRHESKAAIMTEHSTHSPDEAWEDVAPLLEQTVARLRPQDRQAILLRFYEQKPLKEVGAALGISEEAAKKRVARALDELRSLCGRTGLATAATAVTAALLDANVTHAAPGTVATSAASAAVAGSAITPTVTSLASAASRGFSVNAAGVLTVLVLTLAAVGVAFAVIAHSPQSPQPPPRSPLAASGPTTRPIPADGERAIRAAIANRLAAIQSIEAEVDVEERFTPRLPAAPAEQSLPARAGPAPNMALRLRTGTERSTMHFSFLNGAARRETVPSDDVLAAQRANRIAPILRVIETFTSDGYEQLIYRDRETNASIEPYKVPPRWDPFAIALGLRSGFEGPGGQPQTEGAWITREILATMTVHTDPDGRVRLSRTNTVGQTLEWIFNPANGHALVAYRRRAEQPTAAIIDEITAADFKPVNGVPLPTTITARTLLPDGYELQRWQATVTHYALKDPANIADRYHITWPAGMSVMDRRTLTERRADASGHLPPLPVAPLAADDPRSALTDDASTPKGAARLFLNAVIRADAEAAKALVAADIETAAQVDALIEEADALHALDQAAIAHFGAAAEGKLAASPFANQLRLLPTLEVRITENRAALSLPHRPQPSFDFIHAADGWKVVRLPGAGPEMAQRAYSMANISSRLAAEISQGKYATVGAASSELLNRMKAGTK